MAGSRRIRKQLPASDDNRSVKGPGPSTPGRLIGASRSREVVVSSGLISVPHEESVLTLKSAGDLVNQYDIPREYRISIPLGVNATMNIPGRFIVYKESLEQGLRFPLSKFVREILNYYCLHPGQLQPQSWGFIAGFEIRCREIVVTPTSFLFREYFSLCRSPSSRIGYSLGYYFKARSGMPLLKDPLNSRRDWRKYFFCLEDLPAFVPHKWVEISTDRVNVRTGLSALSVLFCKLLQKCHPEPVLDTLKRIGGKVFPSPAGSEDIATEAVETEPGASVVNKGT